MTLQEVFGLLGKKPTPRAMACSSVDVSKWEPDAVSIRAKSDNYMHAQNGYPWSVFARASTLDDALRDFEAAWDDEVAKASGTCVPTIKQFVDCGCFGRGNGSYMEQRAVELEETARKVRNKYGCNLSDQLEAMVARHEDKARAFRAALERGETVDVVEDDGHEYRHTEEYYLKCIRCGYTKIPPPLPG